MSECLRKAEEADADLLFLWANDPEVRKNSFSTAQISYEEHKKWFSDILQDASRTQYIYLVDQVPVGQIRVARQGESAEISYSICAEQRGRGHGKKMLGLLQQLFMAEPDIHILTAKVKEGNQASQQAFLHAGYQKKYIQFELNLRE